MYSSTKLRLISETAKKSAKKTHEGFSCAYIGVVRIVTVIRLLSCEGEDGEVDSYNANEKMPKYLVRNASDLGIYFAYFLESSSPLPPIPPHVGAE